LAWPIIQASKMQLASYVLELIRRNDSTWTQTYTAN